MAFPTVTTVLDDFNRANEGPPPTGWSTVSGTGFSVVSNQCKLASGTSGLSRRTGSGDFGADCEHYATLATKAGAAGRYAGVAARFSNSANTAYWVFLVESAGTDTWEIWKYVAGVSTQLGATITGPEVTAGDKIGIECNGTTISAYVFQSSAWTLVGSRTDSAISAGGRTGLYMDQTTGIWDDISGGTTVPASTFVPRIILG